MKTPKLCYNSIYGRYSQRNIAHSFIIMIGMRLNIILAHSWFEIQIYIIWTAIFDHFVNFEQTHSNDMFDILNRSISSSSRKYTIKINE